MRVLPLLALGLLLVAAPLTHASRTVDASAVGTASLTATDWWTGATLCRGKAAIAVEANPVSGFVAWDAPACPASYGAGAQPFTYWCTDACFHDCWSWDGVMTCERDGTVLTLASDGAFTLHRDADGVALDAAGTLRVITWAD